MRSLMLYELIAHKGAADVRHREEACDSGSLQRHLKTSVDQLLAEGAGVA